MPPGGLWQHRDYMTLHAAREDEPRLLCNRRLERYVELKEWPTTCWPFCKECRRKLEKREQEAPLPPVLVLGPAHESA